ncbi:hypothetical protein J6590_001189 [Homalodisca vitripennis]|nr:hypothetical protein J6590_001189 [Homalodisca vitripennis]
MISTRDAFRIAPTEIKPREKPRNEKNRAVRRGSGRNESGASRNENCSGHLGAFAPPFACDVFDSHIKDWETELIYFNLHLYTCSSTVIDHEF